MAKQNDNTVKVFAVVGSKERVYNAVRYGDAPMFKTMKEAVEDGHNAISKGCTGADIYEVTFKKIAIVKVDVQVTKMK